MGRTPRTNQEKSGNRPVRSPNGATGNSQRRVQVSGGGGPSVKITGASLWSPGGAAMSWQDLLLWVFCLIDDELKALNLPRLRTRGQQATALTDAEVITVELVGEFWGLDADTALYRHFAAYHAAEFPALPRVHRTTFARQA